MAKLLNQGHLSSVSHSIASLGLGEPLSGIDAAIAVFDSSLEAINLFRHL